MMRTKVTRAQLKWAQEWLAKPFVDSPITEGYRLATATMPLPRTAEGDMGQTLGHLATDEEGQG